MKAILFELLGIALAILCIIFAYVHWDEIKVGVKNAFEWVDEVREEREKAKDDPILTGGGFEE